MLKKTSLLTRPTLARRDAPYPKQGRSKNLPTPYTSLKGSGRSCPLLRASSDHCFIVGALRARRAPGRSPPPFFSILLNLELGVVEPGIHPFMSDQRLVGPVFDDMSVVHDNDSIDAMDGGEAMRNDDRRPPFREIVQCLTNLDLGLRVDIGCGLIEHDDRRVLQDHTGYRYTLPLSDGELDAALSDPGIVPVRKSHDKVMRTGHLRRRLNLVLPGHEVTVQNILSHRAIEQEWLLLNQPDLTSKKGQRQFADIVPIDGDGSLRHIVKPHQQFERGALSCPARADKRDAFSRTDGYRDVGQDRRIGPIMKPDAKEVDLSS